MVLMLQKELATRIVSKHNTKDYGRISVMVQTFCNVNVETNISKNVFFPKPGVDSSIIKFKKRNQKINHNNFSLFIKECFKQRRKKIKNNLKNVCNIDILKDLAEKRPENISVKNYIKLYKKIYI
jgi:16S rRNA (adenine1518-N6/adenine1519-N6)-dimethyltransferase